MVQANHWQCMWALCSLARYYQRQSKRIHRYAPHQSSTLALSLRMLMFPGKDTLISRLLKECVPRAPNERALVLEESSELQRVHTSAAVQGDTVPPESAKAEVDFHYVCFVPSHRNGHLYEMDGDKWGGPIDLGVHLEEGEDLLTERVLEVVRAFVQRNKHNEGFSLMALVEQERK